MLYKIVSAQSPVELMARVNRVANIKPKESTLRDGREASSTEWPWRCAGGMIYDSLGSYSFLYLGSFGMGLGAFVIAMTFRPFPKKQKEKPLPAMA